MVTTTDNNIEFKYFTQNIFQNIIDKSLYRMKFMLQDNDKDDNVLTYSLSHDEKQFVLDSITRSSTLIEEAITRITLNSENSNKIISEEMIQFNISTNLLSHTINIDNSKSNILDNFFEMFIINYSLWEWGKTIAMPDIISDYEKQKDYIFVAIEELLNSFSHLDIPKSYTISKA